MANLRLFKKKIKSAKNIAKITRAMQMVAASKMKKAQELAKESREYSDGISDFAALLGRVVDPEKFSHPLLSLADNKMGREIVIFIAPEKGLCGGLISGLSKFFVQFVGGDFSKKDFIAVGKKAKIVIMRMGGNISAEFSVGISQPTYEMIPAIARLIREEFIKGSVSRVSCVYSKFINTLEQEASVKTLLPLNFTEIEEKGEVSFKNKSTLFEPDAALIAGELLDRYLEVELYQLVLEAYASEQSARMTAMKNANDNAKSLISELELGYNKERQTKITSEISDIAGAIYINQ